MKARGKRNDSSATSKEGEIVVQDSVVKQVEHGQRDWRWEDSNFLGRRRLMHNMIEEQEDGYFRYVFKRDECSLWKLDDNDESMDIFPLFKPLKNAADPQTSASALIKFLEIRDRAYVATEVPKRTVAQLRRKSSFRRSLRKGCDDVIKRLMDVSSPQSIARDLRERLEFEKLKNELEPDVASDVGQVNYRMLIQNARCNTHERSLAPLKKVKIEEEQQALVEVCPYVATYVMPSFVPKDLMDVSWVYNNITLKINYNQVGIVALYGQSADVAAVWQENDDSQPAFYKNVVHDLCDMIKSISLSRTSCDVANSCAIIFDINAVDGIELDISNLSFCALESCVLAIKEIKEYKAKRGCYATTSLILLDRESERIFRVTDSTLQEIEASLERGEAAKDGIEEICRVITWIVKITAVEQEEYLQQHDIKKSDLTISVKDNFLIQQESLRSENVAAEELGVPHGTMVTDSSVTPLTGKQSDFRCCRLQ